MIDKKDAVQAYLLVVGKRIQDLNNIPPRVRQCIDPGQKKLKPEARKLITVVATGGKFEILHPGHAYVFREAKKHGDLLVVVAASDQLIEKSKRRKPLLNQRDRILMLSSLRDIDLAVAGGEDRNATLDELDPDVIVFGYDQATIFGDGQLKGKKTVRLEKHGNYSSSALAEQKAQNAGQ